MPGCGSRFIRCLHLEPVFGVLLGAVDVVEEIVKGVMSSDPVHGYPHVERVKHLALKIASNYPEADKEVIELSALLHDIARNGRGNNAKEGFDHALASARVAEVILKALGLPKEKVEAVAHAIEAHSFSAGREPKSLEAKILSDADKLDALGAIGVVRVFMYSATIGRSIKDSIAHFESKILKLPSLMWTPEGKEEARRRVKFVVEFLRELKAELST